LGWRQRLLSGCDRLSRDNVNEIMKQQSIFVIYINMLQTS
jgi:hypothetical protein